MLDPGYMGILQQAKGSTTKSWTPAVAGVAIRHMHSARGQESTRLLRWLCLRLLMLNIEHTVPVVLTGAMLRFLR